jgi:hypothetical protein
LQNLFYNIFLLQFIPTDAAGGRLFPNGDYSELGGRLLLSTGETRESAARKLVCDDGTTLVSLTEDFI